MLSNSFARWRYLHNLQYNNLSSLVFLDLLFVFFLQLFPSQIPDITLGQPLILSGRYKGQFPDEVELRGTLADMSCFTIELTVEKAKDIPLDKVTSLLS